MDQDYGTLTCAGQNEVGEQSNPCVFQVILAGKQKNKRRKWLSTLELSFPSTALKIFSNPLTSMSRRKQENFSDTKLLSTLK